MNRIPRRNTPSGAVPRARWWRRRLAWAVAVVAATAVLVAGVLVAIGSSPAPDAGAPTSEPEPTPQYTRPAEWSAYRPAVHLTPAERWMNDPQRPFWLDGRWHYYYLYNADYPDGNGTEWYHATSTDLVHWRDEGVAIAKYENGLGDIETGSTVIDTENTAGFGAGAVIAILTQQHEGVQRQSLFVSTDGGSSFEPFDGNPVMDNPGQAHWRDPKIVWDEERDEWLMVLAEGHKIGFYTSPDLRSWSYRSGFERDGLGILECPDLFRMSLDGDPAKTTWVLAAGVNGSEHGMTTGTAYWTGEWNGDSFTPDATSDAAEPTWLDHGADFYATVTWDDPRLPEAERLASRYSIGWLNNWAYAGDLPTTDWHGGADSVVRELSLRTVEDRPTLVSTPVDALSTLEGEAEALKGVRVTDAASTPLPQPDSDAYRLRVEVAADPQDPASEVRFRIKEGGGAFATVGVDFAAGIAFVARDADAAAGSMPHVYREVRTAPVTPRDGVVTLDLIVDAASLEVFVNDGEAVLSNVVFGAPGANGLSVEAVGGAVELRSLRLSPLAVAPVVRLGSSPAPAG